MDKNFKTIVKNDSIEIINRRKFIISTSNIKTKNESAISLEFNNNYLNYINTI